MLTDLINGLFVALTPPTAIWLLAGTAIGLVVGFLPVVMYGGGAESCLAAMRGDVDVVFQVAGTVLRQAEARGGKLIPNVIFADKRIPFAPNLPTVKELGVGVPEDIMTLLAYNLSITAPYGVPDDVVKILGEAIEKTLRNQDLIKKIKRAKITVDLLSPVELQKKIQMLSRIMPLYIEAVQQALGK